MFHLRVPITFMEYIHSYTATCSLPGTWSIYMVFNCGLTWDYITFILTKAHEVTNP